MLHVEIVLENSGKIHCTMQQKAFGRSSRRKFFYHTDYSTWTRARWFDTRYALFWKFCTDEVWPFHASNIFEGSSMYSW